MDRLEQDAADEPAAHEQQSKWRERVRVDIDRANALAPTKTWAPVHTEQQKRAHDQYAIDNNLPF